MYLGNISRICAAATIIDYSMLSAGDAAREREDRFKETGEGSRPGANAFDDLTDQQNNEFIVSDVQDFSDFVKISFPLEYY